MKARIKRLNKSPLFLLLLINLLAFILFYFQKDKSDNTSMKIIIGFILSVFILNYVLSKISLGDNYLFLLVSFLSSLGVIMIYRLEVGKGLKQIWFNGVGILAFFLVYIFLKKMKNWDKYALVYFFVSMGLFILTLLIGKNINGARNWIFIAGVSIQPSEFIKIFFVLYMASFYKYRDVFKENLRKRWKFKKIPVDIGLTILFIGSLYIFIGFLFLQSELGISLLFFLVLNVILFVFEPNRKIIFINILAAIVMAVVGYFLFSHVKLRIDIWRDPWNDIGGRGYQIIQSFFAIAEGGFFGKGLGLGSPGFVPEVHNDFIFSAICEEMGIFTGIAIVLIYLIIVYRGIKIALRQEDKFLKVLSFGLSVSIGFQAFIILGGVTGMIPLTGITLPFISHGGSSLLASFISLSLIQLSSENIKFEELENE